MIKIELIFAICVFLAGCGQMGALYLPENATAAQQDSKAMATHE